MGEAPNEQREISRSFGKDCEGETSNSSHLSSESPNVYQSGNFSLFLRLRGKKYFKEIGLPTLSPFPGLWDVIYLSILFLVCINSHSFHNVLVSSPFQ